MADFAEQRVKMVDGQIRTTDVTSRELLFAMLTVPREEFVPSRRRALAYVDADIEISGGGDGAGPRHLMEPSPFAKLIQFAEVQSHEFVLVVGAGSGYSAAVLSLLCGSVVALESDETLASQASETLARLGYDNVAVVSGPLEAGYPSQAPYDLIFVEGAVDAVPDALLEQLRDGGRLVTVVGEGPVGQATLFRREHGLVSSRRSFNASVKPLDAFRHAPSFAF